MDEQEQDEPEALQATVLPAREAMSIITPDRTTPSLPEESASSESPGTDTSLEDTAGSTT